MPTSQYHGKAVLITGGCGFIGSNLAHKLVALGARVLIVDSMIPDHGGNLFNLHDIYDKVRINFCDVRDGQAMSYLVREQDYIFNLAGQVSHLDSMMDPVNDLEINARSQLALMEACRLGNPQAVVVMASTRQIYGRPQRLPMDETHPVEPMDVNGINKWAGEQFHLLYHRVYGLKTVCLRLTNTYGPRQLLRHAKQGFIGWFVGQVLRGEEIQLFGDGSQMRDFNHVDDVVDALLLAAALPGCIGKVFNLGGPPVSLQDLVKLLIEVNGQGSYRLVPFPQERKRIDVGDAYTDYSLFQQAAGWQPRVELRPGLGQTLAYFRGNLAHYH